MAASIYSRTLQKASELLGGHARLCRELQVPAQDLENWIAGKAVVPRGVFLKAVDLVISETPAPPGGDSDPSEPSAPRDCASTGIQSGQYC